MGTDITLSGTVSAISQRVSIGSLNQAIDTIEAMIDRGFHSEKLNTIVDRLYSELEALELREIRRINRSSRFAQTAALAV